ncbi:hypothetical protein [Plasmodium yoelii yoelii]|uniref:Uncharacterized protein n=1 Tax=Plasmodium yoelii yoelii TaxID=73239 RepID=Q7R7B1_PLAYO|nr:hypothetical protein [Plasmodium yoelii yoelii]
MSSFLGFQFYSIDLGPVSVPHSFSHYCSVKQLDVRDVDSPRSSFIVENSFCYPRIFVIQNELANFSF